MSSSEPNNSGALDPSSLAPRILQVVQGDGTFDEPAVQAYMHSSGVESTGIDYTVVAIMGPQSSGKSTLLNALVCCRVVVVGGGVDLVAVQEALQPHRSHCMQWGCHGTHERGLP